MQSPQQHNQRAWNERARRRLRHTRTATEKDLRDPLRSIDPEGWLSDGIIGRRVLCLAAGGGLQSALYAAAGAVVTVVDISAEMLELDREVAARHGFKISLHEGSMDDLHMLPEAGYDFVIQPVSTCYVPDISAVYREVARVTVPGGLYISQHKQPVNLQASALPTSQGYLLTEPYYRSGPLPPVVGDLRHRESGTLEFLHRWEELLGFMCRSGFVIEDLSEPRHHDPHAEPGTPEHRYCYVPPYVKIKARRTATGLKSALWIPPSF